MDVNFVITYIICQLTLFSVDVKGAEIYFDVITDPVLVETFAVSASQMESQRDSESPAPDVITEEDALAETIFNRNKNELLRLCADVIPLDTYGFQFELDSYRSPKTAKRSFQVVHIETPTNELLRLEMLNYPPISYLDLETNQRHNFMDAYFLSPAADRNSAILFKRRHEDRKIYPLRCITNIAFETLTRLSATTANAETRYPSDPILDPISEDSNEKIIADAITTYQTVKRSANLYTKFTKLFASFSVCGFPHKHKVHACRRALEINSTQVKLDIEQHFQEPCKKRLVHFADGSAGDSSKTAEIYLSRCSPTLNVSITKPLRLTTFFYVASTASSRSVLLFSRLNMKGERVQPLRVVHNVDVRPMQQDSQRAKLYSTLPVRPSVITPESSYENLKKLIRFHLPGRIPPVQMPLTLARRRGPTFDVEEKWQSKTRFIHGGSEVERALIELAQIKRNVFVYQKFIETYTSIDFCYLSALERKSLCDEVMSDTEYGWIPNPYFVTQVYPCYRQKVALTTFEAERLQTETFSMWGCPPPSNRRSCGYYLGKSHLRDATILFRDSYYNRAFNRMNAVHPVTLFLNINRYKLARLIPV